MKINVLVLLWHSTIDSSVTAGGIRRIIEFVKRIPEDMNFHILDNSPTIFDFQSPRHNVYQYGTPKIVYRILKFNFILGRSLEWITTPIKLFFKAREVLRQQKCQIIYLPDSQALFLFIPAVIIKVFYGGRILSDMLNFEMPYGSVLNYFKVMRSNDFTFLRSLLLPTYIKFQNLVIKFLFRKIDYIITVSQYLADFIKKAGAKCPVGFTPSGVDCQFINNIPVGTQHFDGIFVGRHSIEKGIFDLIEVWKRVSAVRPNSRLVMVGFCDAATREKIDNKLKEYELEQNIFIRGTLDEEEKIKIVKSSKVFIHLGSIEPLVPVITVLEGLACGLPVVLCDQPSYKEHPEIYQHPSFALVPCGDYKAAAGEIISFINMDGSLRNIVSQRAKEYARGYDWDNISQIEFDIIKQMNQPFY